MIPVDFFGCRREQIIRCTWEEACEQFPCSGITLPDGSAFATLGEALTGRQTLSAQQVGPWAAPLYCLSHELTTVIREATAEELKEAGVRWAELPPWKNLNTNSMDLAGFLLDLQTLVYGGDREENCIFFSIEAGAFHFC